MAALPALFLGAYAAQDWFAFIPNLTGILIGALLFRLNIYKLIRIHPRAWSVVLLALVASTLLLPGQAGVHRWILNVNASMIIAPALLLCIHASSNYVATIIMSILLLWQPDAGQATAFGAAAMPLFLLNGKLPRGIRIATVTLIATLVGLAWTRPDSLQPVEHVEGILNLIYDNGTLPILMAAFVLLFQPFGVRLKFTIKSCDQNAFALASALTIYAVTQFIVTAFAPYPVPIIGAGIAPVIGWYIILNGLLKPHTEFKGFTFSRERLNL